MADERRGKAKDTFDYNYYSVNHYSIAPAFSVNPYI